MSAKERQLTMFSSSCQKILGGLKKDSLLIDPAGMKSKFGLKMAELLAVTQVQAQLKRFFSSGLKRKMTEK
tara:strand:+ start:44 stop:256 length:213 start_codon:yes stop_codon:yes gene_type:complete